MMDAIETRRRALVILAKVLAVCLVLALLVRPVAALKRDVLALPASSATPFLREFCSSTHVSPHSLVVGEYTIENTPNIVTAVHVLDSLGNKLHDKPDQVGHHMFTFVSADEEVEVQTCFTNTLKDGIEIGPQHSRVIDFVLNTGDDARGMDKSKETAALEKLKPVEEQLKHLETTMEEIVKGLEHLREREIGMRDVNESTNSRVRTLSILSMLVLVGSGAYQIVYLRKYFKTKKLI